MLLTLEEMSKEGINCDDISKELSYGYQLMVLQGLLVIS
jgi:hypothetical protein